MVGVQEDSRPFNSRVFIGTNSTEAQNQSPRINPENTDFREIDENSKLNSMLWDARINEAT